MKYLKDYTEKLQTELFKKTSSFFAFSNSQFNESKKEGVKYCDVGAGLICPVENAKVLIKELKQINKNGIQTDLLENGKEGVILRELYNHECFYTYEIDDCVRSLKKYKITIEEIRSVFNAEIKK